MEIVAVELISAFVGSILAFILGVLIGVALGYIIWSERKDST